MNVLKDPPLTVTEADSEYFASALEDAHRAQKIPAAAMRSALKARARAEAQVRPRAVTIQNCSSPTGGRSRCASSALAGTRIATSPSWRRTTQFAARA